MGRVQGGARAAFATLSWGPARMTYFLHLKTDFELKNNILVHFWSKSAFFACLYNGGTLLTRILIFALAVFAYASQPHLDETISAPPFDEAQVFEWWDDGIITPEQADEIFSRLEEENYDEACLLAEVYAQEPCAAPKQEKKPRKKKPKKAKATPPKSEQNVTIIPHGHVAWKGQYDSDGHLKKHRKELQVQFYHFKLRLGSQELLTYQRDGFESHFGQISTIELRSHLPLDTLWGTAFFIPIGKFKFGAALDTSKTFQAQIDFSADRSNKIAASYWKFPDANAVAMQARTTLGQISAWYQFGQDRPLVKIQLQSEKRWISWKTTAYIHGDSLPLGLNLSKGIAENWLWASQTVNLQWPEMQNAVLSAKARVLSPVATDSVSARFKLSLEAGPKHLRPSLNVTCIEASDNCKTTEWKSDIESSWERVSLHASAKLRHEKRTKPPKIELGASYRTPIALAKLTVAFPEANPAKAVSVQNEVKLDSDFLGCNFIFAFKKTKTRPFSPNYAHLNASLKF